MLTDKFISDHEFGIVLALVVLCLSLLFVRLLHKQPMAMRVVQGLQTQLRALVASAASTFWYGVCCTYLVWWSISLPVRRLLTASTISVLGLSSLFFLFEGISTLFHREVLKTEFPLLVQIIIVLLAGGMVFHRVEEWKHQKQKWDLAFALRFLIPEIRRFGEDIGGGCDKKAKFMELADKIMSAFSAIFRESKEVNLNLMILGQDRKLRFLCFHPERARASYSTEPFSLDKGGAGTACKSGLLVYIPAVRYRHGISVLLGGSISADMRLAMRRTYDFLDLVYEVSERQPFRSILCVPVRVNSKCEGVLNLDSMKQNAFGEFDFDLADVAAALIGMAIDRSGLAELQ